MAVGTVAEPSLFAELDQFTATAVLLGERIDARALERGEVLGLAPLVIRAGRAGCAIVFRYGAVVLFQLEPAEQAAFLESIRPLVHGAFDEPDYEVAEVHLDAARPERIDPEGYVVLRDSSIGRLQVVAEVLGKSAVLAHYEVRVARVFDRLEPLADAARSGGQGLRGAELLEQIGDVVSVQARTVGRVEVTEKPEIVWDEPELDRLYERLAIEYELRDRDLALGRKLELIASTAQTLLDLLHNKRALRVEWYIVVLIAVEIVFILYDIFFLG